MCERQRVACCAGPVATADTRRSMMCYLDIVSWASQCLRRLVKAYSDKSEKSRRNRHFHCSLQAWHCNSLYHNLPKSQITRLQQIKNSLARAVVKAPKFSHTTPIRSLHWLKITERIEYKLLSLTYKVLTTTQPYLHNLITVQPPRSIFVALHLWSHSLAHPHIIFCKNNRSFLLVCFLLSLESTSGFPPSTTH